MIPYSQAGNQVRLSHSCVEPLALLDVLEVGEIVLEGGDDIGLGCVGTGKDTKSPVGQTGQSFSTTKAAHCWTAHTNG